MENECLYTKANHPFLGYLLVWLVCISLDKQVQHFRNPSIYPSEFSAVQCCCKLHVSYPAFCFHTDLLKATLTLRKSELRCCIIVCRLISVSNSGEKTEESTCVFPSFLGYFELLCAVTSPKCVFILLTSSKLLLNNQTYQSSNHP